MENQPPASAKPRGNKRVLIAFGILGLVVVAALVGGWAYLKFSGQNMAGLEGTWRDPVDPRHTHQFRRNGQVDTWYGVLPMESFATWQRDGQQITVRTTRGWDFVGQLDGGTIRGQMIIRDETRATVNTTDTVWQKE
jgi:hypothetical protein